MRRSKTRERTREANGEKQEERRAFCEPSSLLTMVLILAVAVDEDGALMGGGGGGGGGALPKVREESISLSLLFFCGEVL